VVGDYPFASLLTEPQEEIDLGTIAYIIIFVFAPPLIAALLFGILWLTLEVALLRLAVRERLRIAV
jgi:hypothetical protein